MYISYICFLVFVVLTIYRTIPKLLLCEQCFFFNLCRDLHFTEFISFCFYIALSTLYRQSCILWLILGFYASIFGTARGVVDVLSGYFFNLLSKNIGVQISAGATGVQVAHSLLKVCYEGRYYDFLRVFPLYIDFSVLSNH